MKRKESDGKGSHGQPAPAQRQRPMPKEPRQFHERSTEGLHVLRSTRTPKLSHLMQ